MTFIGLDDAKAQLTKLLDRVSRGERLNITKHGRSMAELVPVGAAEARDVKNHTADAGMAGARRADARAWPDDSGTARTSQAVLDWATR